MRKQNKLDEPKVKKNRKSQRRWHNYSHCHPTLRRNPSSYRRRTSVIRFRLLSIWKFKICCFASLLGYFFFLKLISLARNLEPLSIVRRENKTAKKRDQKKIEEWNFWVGTWRYHFFPPWLEVQWNCSWSKLASVWEPSFSTSLILNFQLFLNFFKIETLLLIQKFFFSIYLSFVLFSLAPLLFLS